MRPKLIHPQEAKENSGVLSFHDDDVNALEPLIHFLYYFTCKDSMIKEGSTLCFAVKVYAIADK
jgi:succinylarginine dihydrolase